MKKYNRREFLRAMLIGSGALAVNTILSACRPKIEPDQAAIPILNTPTNAPAPSAYPTDTTKPTPFSTATTPPTSYLAVARGTDPEMMVRRALASLGGMENFVPQGASVVIKPNICVAYHSYEYAATTNPWVVGALVKLAFEAGAKSVKVMDFPFGGSGEEAYRVSGIEDQVKAAGGEMVVMKALRFQEVDLPDSGKLKFTKIFDEVINSDVLINVPIAKHHGLARLTLGMKNLMGTIYNREALHQNLGVMLTDLASFLRPQLTVVDANRILMANGPTGGNLDDVKEMNTLIASPDIVAADSYAATLFGLQPEDLAYIREGAARGLGRSDLANLKIEEINVDA